MRLLSIPKLLELRDNWALKRKGDIRCLIAAELIQEEYHECMILEARLRLRHRKSVKAHPINIDRVPGFIAPLCTDLGVRPPKVEITTEVYQYYMQHTIFLYPWTSEEAVLHETAHYIVDREGLMGTHNKDFLWVLKLLWEADAERRKQCKS